MTPDDVDSLELRLNAWGERERSGIAEPAPNFMRAVHAARGPRLVARLAGALALAAVLSLVAYVAFRPATLVSPDVSPNSTMLTHTPAAPARAFTVGIGRNADVASVFDLLDAMPQPAGPSAPTPRASDAYCAGCIEELTRL